MRPSSALALALLAAAPAAAAPAAPAQRPPPSPDVLPFRAVERTLPNGLRVVVVPTGFPDLVSVQIAVQTGSRNEVEPGKSGFAHFFEHMMFRGTKRYPPAAYQAAITRMGARQNAYTSDDLTNYHLTFSKQDLEQVLELEADRFMNLDYPVEAFKTESRAILGEYDKNASNPLVKLEEVQRDHAFRVHPYRHTTMGFLADIEDMPNQYEYSRVFYARWYRPEHATVVVAGDVAPEKVLPLVERTFGRWKRGSFAPGIPQEPPPAGPVYAHVPWQTPTLPWVTVAFHGPAFSDTAKDWAAVDLLFDLHFGETSDLYRKLVVEEQVVDALRTDTGPNVDPGLHTVSARLKRPEDAVRVRDELLRAFAAARAAPPDAARLSAEVAHARNAFVRGLDSTAAIAGAVARYAAFDRSYQTLNRLYRTAAALTPADLHAAARAFFTDARLVVTTLSRDPLPAGVEAAPALDALAPGAPGRRARRDGPHPPPVRHGEAAPRGGQRARPAGQGGARRPRGRHARRRRLAHAPHRRDPGGAPPPRRQLRRAGGQGDGDAHRELPAGRLGALRRGGAAAAPRPRLPRGGLPPREGRAPERPRAGPPGGERRGAREGAAPGERLRRGRRTATRRSAPRRGSRR